ncbi:MAG: MFS transporter [Planctomycetia bacterium]|nr:MFS transporter [Planctomycetia bacterium]
MAESRAPAPADPQDKESLPTLARDRAVYGLTITQFLGAFNDSVFKQIAVLLLVRVPDARGGYNDVQAIGTWIFNSSFILLSGISGFWADRISKRTIVVGAKVAEIVVMALGIAAFASMATSAPVPPQAPVSHPETFRAALESIWESILQLPWFLLVVLFCMGAQSAVFGPAKYGILPELVRERDLPNLNSAIQMTTFVALILGAALGGFLLDAYRDTLWKAGIICTLIAVAGTMTAPLVRRTGVAQAGAPFQWSALWIVPEIRALLRTDRKLLGVVAMTTLFWSIGQAGFLAINALGKNVLGKDDFQTSVLLTVMSVGMGIGFVIAGLLSRGKINFRLVTIGTWGLLVSFALLALPGFSSPSTATEPGLPAAPTHLLGYAGSIVLLGVAGTFVGCCFLPLQVFVQSRPPDALKGRMIGASNLLNWIGMALSSLVYLCVVWLLKLIGWNSAAVFGLLALVLLPVALFYRPRGESLA